MRFFSLLGLCALLLLSPRSAPAQEELASVATLHLADGTSVALVEWKVSYEFAIWRQKEPVSSAKPQTREHQMLVLGKKTYPVKGETMTFAHEETDGSFRVSAISLNQAASLKVEIPARDIIAPDLEKVYYYQPRSLDVAGKTLSGIERSFCVVSFSALVDCGATPGTRVVKIDFN